MVNRYLLDTCIWRDFYEDRFSKSGRSLGKYAAGLIINILKKGDIILFSNTLLYELKIKYYEEEISDMLAIFLMSKKLIKIKITKEEDSEASIISKERNLPFTDCLNAILARNHNAIMVTQDNHYFNKLTDIVKSVRPQDIN